MTLVDSKQAREVGQTISGSHSTRDAKSSPTKRLQSDVSLDSLGGWQSFELMPPSFRNAREAKSVLTAWTIVNTFLLAFLLGSVVAIFLRGQAMRRRNAQLVAEAKPLFQIRNESIFLEKQTRVIERYSESVTTAKPDDSLLQILAAVALATHPTEHIDPDDHLQVQSVHVKLALEHSSPEGKTPTWAQPRFTMTAMANKPTAVTQWSGRLTGLERLQQLETKAPNSFFRETLVQANAVPRATRVVP